MHTVTKADEAHDFIEFTERLTGIEMKGTENSMPTYVKEILI